MEWSRSCTAWMVKFSFLFYDWLPTSKATAKLSPKQFCNFVSSISRKYTTVPHSTILLEFTRSKCSTQLWPPQIWLHFKETSLIKAVQEQILDPQYIITSYNGVACETPSKSLFFTSTSRKIVANAWIACLRNSIVCFLVRRDAPLNTIHFLEKETDLKKTIYSLPHMKIALSAKSLFLSTFITVGLIHVALLHNICL